MVQVPMFRPTVQTISPDLLETALGGLGCELLDKLEGQVASMLGVPFVVAASNAALAMHLALSAIDMKRGDKMITSVNAHPSIAQMVRHFDAEPIFADIDPDTFNMKHDAIDAAWSDRQKKLRGVIYSLSAGQSDDLERLYTAIHADSGIVIVESFGSIGLELKLENGAPDMLVTSLFAFGSPSAANVGFIATHSETLRNRARLIRNYGLDNSGANSTGYTYDMVDIGMSYVPSALDVAYTLTALDSIKGAVDRRREIAARYDEAFKALAHVTPPVKKHQHAYTHYVVKVDKNRDDFARELGVRGVEAGLHYIPLHLMSYYRSKYAIKITDFPRALSNYQHILSLPISGNMSDSEVEIVINAVKEIDHKRAW